MPIKAHNPYPSHKDWKKEKDKYGIPGNVVKYSMGKKLESFRKEFEKEDFKNNLTPQTLPKAKNLYDRSESVYNEYTAAIKKLDNKKFKHKNLASDKCKKNTLALLSNYMNYIVSFKNVMSTVSDPFSRPRLNIKKAKEYLAEAKNNKDDSVIMNKMYGNGMRNDLGVFFNEAAKEYKKGNIALTPDVVKKITQYNTIMSKWNKTIDMSLEKVNALLDDMDEAMAIGEEILRLTDPG